MKLFGFFVVDCMITCLHIESTFMILALSVFYMSRPVSCPYQQSTFLAHVYATRPVSCLHVSSTCTRLFLSARLVHFYESRSPVSCFSSCQLSIRFVHIYTPRPLLLV